MRIEYGLAAVATADPDRRAAPLTVNFDGAGSATREAGDTLTYAWDLDGDGQYDDSTARERRPSPTRRPASYAARLKVTDQRGGSAISAPITITAGNRAPTAVDRHAGLDADLEGRRHDHVLRARHRPAGRRAAAERAVVAGHHSPLPVQLPHARLPDVLRRRERLLPGARPRVPVVPRDPADRDRQSRR